MTEAISGVVMTSSLTHSWSESTQVTEVASLVSGLLVTEEVPPKGAALGDTSPRILTS